MFNVGLIGTGYWGKKIQRELDNHPLVNSVKVATTSEWLKPETIFNDSTITHVFIATPVETHYDLCKEALLTGKNVMCEKNFTETYEQAFELVSLAAMQNKTLLVDYIHTFTLPALSFDAMDADYVRIDITQFGRFRDEHVFSVLGSHAMSVLGTYYDIHTGLELVSSKATSSQNGCNTTCCTEWKLGDKRISINVSLDGNPLNKVRQISFYTKDSYCLDSFDFSRPDGLSAMIDTFLAGSENSILAEDVTKCVELVRGLK